MMSIALDILCLDVPFTMLFSTVLYVATGVGGCGWPISAREFHMGVSFWKFPNDPPNFSSVSYTMTFLMILHSTFYGLFSWGIAVIVVLLLYFVPSKK